MEHAFLLYKAVAIFGKMRVLLWLAYTIVLLHGWVPHIHLQEPLCGTPSRVAAHTPVADFPLHWHHTHSLSVPDNLSGDRTEHDDPFVRAASLTPANLCDTLQWQMPPVLKVLADFSDHLVAGVLRPLLSLATLRGPPRCA